MLALPLLATMALAGIWHGSGWSFLLFGLLHGLFLSVNHAWRLRYPGRRSTTVTAVVGRVALTYLCVLVGAVVFRAPSVTASLSMLAAMTGWHGVVLSAPDPRSLYHAVLDLLWLGALFAIVWCAPNTQQIMDAVATRSGSARLRWRQSTPWAVAFGCAATLGLLSIGGTGEFVYFRF
jgi:D-alanyl-lipoteichoic acid acyltransferase DltB (MBOAT superfamily)